MGSGVSDLAGDQERGRKHHHFLKVLADYLESPEDNLLANLEKAAEDTDSVIRGLYSRPTSLVRGLQETVQELRAGDKRKWASLLTSIDQTTSAYEKLKRLSPFKDMILLVVDYGRGFVTMRSEDVHRLIREGDYLTFDSDSYLVAFPRGIRDKIDVVWTGCGIRGQDGPRNSEGKPK